MIGVEILLFKPILLPAPSLWVKLVSGDTSRLGIGAVPFGKGELFVGGLALDTDFEALLFPNSFPALLVDGVTARREGPGNSEPS
jgi:hypothetical protein